MSEWQLIETAPRERIGPESYHNHGPAILCCVRGTGLVFMAHWNWHRNGKTGNWKIEYANRVPWQTPTHWMPLPESVT